jgi:hypothetical protein
MYINELPQKRQFFLLHTYTRLGDSKGISNIVIKVYV